MARELFLDIDINSRIKTSWLGLKYRDLDDFRFVERVRDHLTFEIQKIMESHLNQKHLSKLYLLGSFGRGHASLNSDLDLFYDGDQGEAEEVAKILRIHFRNFSIRSFPNQIEFSENDPFGPLSFFKLKPVFADSDPPPPPQIVLPTEIKRKSYEAILKDQTARKHKYGNGYGKINFNIKHGVGALKSIHQVDWCRSHNLALAGVSDLNSGVRELMLRVRFLNHCKGQLDVIDFNQGHFFLEQMPRFEKVEEFFNALYDSLFQGYCYSLKLHEEGEPTSPDLALQDPLSVSSRKFLFSAFREYESKKGLISSPSYHTWTVDEHLLQCVHEVNSIILEKRSSLCLTTEEEEDLRWAAFFHDIKKGGSEAHSLAGAKYVQEFGASQAWSQEKIHRVSWLVREHLTLSKYCFKVNPHSSETLRRLYHRGVLGRNAVMLFVLTEADIKATNLSTWSEWKKSVLELVLQKLLKQEISVKQDLLEQLKEEGLGRDLALELEATELMSVPEELLLKDLESLGNHSKGAEFYQNENKIWLRYYSDDDERGLAFSLVKRVYLCGGKVHRAYFRTTSKGQVYDWICIESQASFKSFAKRWALVETDDTLEGLPSVEFRRIRRTYFDGQKAVVSFKGLDQPGALASAMGILYSYGLDIEWGHAVSWGREIEDVFGVSFQGEVDWEGLCDDA